MKKDSDMKMRFSILLTAMLPLAALAAGEHAGGHHDDDTHAQHMPQEHGAMAHGGHHGGNFGRPGDPTRVDRTIDVIVGDDMRFVPDQVTVKAGETIRFFVRNQGNLPHEMVIGSMAELKAHAAMMRKQPQMQHVEPNMISLTPGQRGGIVWQFDRAGTVDFACLVPGHLEAGMVGKVVVD